MSTQSTAKGGWLDRTFRLSEKHTTVKREFLAGLTTFLTMVYIVAVNPSILGDAGHGQECSVLCNCDLLGNRLYRNCILW